MNNDNVEFREFTITDAQGVHFRPATAVVQICNKYKGKGLTPEHIVIALKLAEDEQFDANKLSTEEINDLFNTKKTRKGNNYAVASSLINLVGLQFTQNTRVIFGAKGPKAKELIDEIESEWKKLKII